MFRIYFLEQILFPVFLSFSITVLSSGLEDKFSCDSYCKCLDSFADCSNQQLAKFPSEIPPWIETLKLNKNMFSEIPTFQRSSNLTHLNLAHNKIIFIDGKALQNLPSLKSLELNNNQISDITVFPNCTELEVLNLNSNHISIIESGSLSGLSNLKDLRLSRNKLTYLSKDLFNQLNKLEILEINRNLISSIVGLSFQGLEYLVILKLRQNTIEELADGAFYGLWNLRELHLDHNKLTRVSKGWLYGLEMLTYLNVSNNRVQYLNSGWESCPHLIKLDMSHNKLQSIERRTFEHLTKLQLLKIDNNQIMYIENGAFDFVPSLQYLDLSDNHISWIVEDGGGTFSPLKKLIHLSVASNEAQKISADAFSGLESLTDLDLTNNPISEIERYSFSEMAHLRNLLMNTTSLICDCNLSWLPLWLNSSTHVNVKRDDLLCVHPYHLKMQPVFTVPGSGFKCDPNDGLVPKIIMEPEEAVALLGDNITLHCSANSSSESDMNFVWKRNNHRLENSSAKKYVAAQVVGRAQYSDLQLFGITMDHNGYYQCIASNQYGVAYSKLSQLSVLVFPSFVKVPANVVVKVGSTAKLECTATGYPTPHISWQKDGGSDFPAAHERRMKVMETEEPILILNVKLSDVGVYTCTAKNTAGVITANATLTVLEGPSLSKRMEDKDVTIGDAIIIECMANGSPKPRILWLKDGKQMQLTKRHFLTAEDQLLIIMNADKSDAGLYECQLSNSLGIEYGRSYLSVSSTKRSSGAVLSSICILGFISLFVSACCTACIWLCLTQHSNNDDNKTIRSQLATADCNLDDSSEKDSKDSGTGDSTRRSYEDLLLAGGSLNNSSIIHEEHSDSPSLMPEVTLPLLTTFHPAGLDSASSSLLNGKDNGHGPPKTRYVNSMNLTPVHIQNRHDHAVSFCSSPASSNGAAAAAGGTQCVCVAAGDTLLRRKAAGCCGCSMASCNNSPVKQATTANGAGVAIASNHCCTMRYNHERSCSSDSGKRPCSIPAPGHTITHSTVAVSNCCRHYHQPNTSYLCLYTTPQRNV